MSANAPPPEPAVVCDTVVVSYFLAVGAFDVLHDLVGPVRVPRAVFDPEEHDELAEEAMSELRRGLLLHERRAADAGLARTARERSQRVLEHFRRLPHLAAEGRLVAVDLRPEEVALFAEFRDVAAMRAYSLVAGLGRGEAAALAITENRNWGLATDDNDAIRVGLARIPGLVPLRVRSLLELANEEGLITRTEAREIHAAMKAIGFWDKGEIE